MFSLIFGLHHADTAINLMVCHHKILKISRKLHLEGDRLFHVSLQEFLNGRDKDLSYFYELITYLFKDLEFFV